MLVKEYRIPFPATLEDYRIGMLYMISRATDEENNRDHGKKRNGKKAIQVVKRERYFDETRKLDGVYTEKICYVRQFFPGFIKWAIPDEKSIFIEKSWNSFPDHCLTIYECPFLGDSFHLSIESCYVGNDRGFQNNVLNLQEKDLENREVIHLNMASEEHLRLTPETDVCSFRSKKSVHPVMDNNGVWMREGSPMMCCYKVARLDVSTKGFPGKRIERWGHKNGVQAAFLHYNRQLFCWMDSWLGLRIEDVDGFEDTQERTRVRGRKSLKEAATALATELAAESSAGLAFSFSDETNPFVT